MKPLTRLRSHGWECKAFKPGAPRRQPFRTRLAEIESRDQYVKDFFLAQTRRARESYIPCAAGDASKKAHMECPW